MLRTGYIISVGNSDNPAFQPIQTIQRIQWRHGGNIEFFQFADNLVCSLIEKRPSVNPLRSAIIISLHLQQPIIHKKGLANSAPADKGN